MRKVILSAALTLDGYIARRDGSVDFLQAANHSDPDLLRSMTAFFGTIDTAVMGRKTFDAALEMTGGTYDGHGLATYVMSRSLPPGEREGVTFTDLTPRDLVATLRAYPGKDIFLMGGGETARAFLKDDLVDDLRLGIVPVLLGDGLPLFPAGFPQRDFQLVECRHFANGAAALRYERRR